jgi:predicted house-cleaning noncanonical NTP pyrophosphatase (MazG superfamily)
MQNQDISTIGESFAKMFQEIERNTQDAFRKITESFHEKLHETMQEFQAIAKSFSDALHELPDELRPIITKLSARSWYISGDMDIPFLRRLDENIEISEEGVDKIMSQWVSDNIEKIVERAKEKYPERKAIIDAAFWAHNNEKYELSIPIMLIQIDGMGYEKFNFDNGSLYSKRPDKKSNEIITIIKRETDYYINNQNSFTELLLMQLREKSPLIASSKESTDYPDAINRHNIIHGINTGYATQLNSLKVFSLLEYFISFFSDTDFNEKNAD